MAAIVNLDCSSSDEENTSKSPEIKPKEELCSNGNRDSSFDSSDSDDGRREKTPVRRTGRKRTVRGLATLMEARKNDQSPPSPDDPEQGLYASRAADTWNKATIAKLQEARKAQESDEEDDKPFSPVKRRRGRKGSKGKGTPSPMKITEVQDDENNNTSLNNSVVCRERSPTPPPTPVRDVQPKKKTRMAKGCRQAMNNLRSLQAKVRKGEFDVEDDVVIVDEEPPSTPEEQKQITVKVKSRSGIQRFPMKKNESFNRVMVAMAKHEGVSQDHIMFLSDRNDNVIYPYQTPLTVGLTVADIIVPYNTGEARFMSDRIRRRGPRFTTFYIQGKHPRTKRKHKITMIQPFEKIMLEYARKMNVPSDQLTYHFDGEKLEPQDTPTDHGLDLDETITIDVIGL